jgi:hypothetical protein
VSVGLHWLGGTFPVGNLPAVVRLVEFHFGEMSEMERGIYTYRQGVRFGDRAPHPVVCYTYQPDDVMGVRAGEFLRPEAFVEVPGEYLDQLSFDASALLLGALHGQAFRCSRVDVKYDDFDWVRSPQVIDEEFAATGRYAPAFGATHHGDRGTGGYTVQFGQKGKQGCGAQVVIYDKNAQSGGEVNAVRYEARFFKERAAEAFRSLVCPDFEGDACVDDARLPGRIGALVGGSIDFFEETKSGRKRAAWWEAIRGKLRRL